jgi:hypothetical protein
VSTIETFSCTTTILFIFYFSGTNDLRRDVSMSRSRLPYSLTPFEYLEKCVCFFEKQSFGKDLTSRWWTLLENPVGIHHREILLD